MSFKFAKVFSLVVSQLEFGLAVAYFFVNIFFEPRVAIKASGDRYFVQLRIVWLQHTLVDARIVKLNLVYLSKVQIRQRKTLIGRELSLVRLDHPSHSEKVLKAHYGTFVPLELDIAVAELFVGEHLYKTVFGGVRTTAKFDVHTLGQILITIIKKDLGEERIDFTGQAQMLSLDAEESYHKSRVVKRHELSCA